MQAFLKPFVNHGLLVFMFLLSFSIFNGQFLSYSSMNKSKKELYAVFTSLEIKEFSQDCLSRSLINASSDCLFTCLICLFCWYLCLVMLCPEIENTGR